MNNEVQDQLQKAIAYSFLLLKYRLRSEYEIRSRLKRKKFEPDIIEAAVSFLKNKDFISDRDFARLWLESRIKRSCGLQRIRRELKLKGIAKDLIQEAQDSLLDYNEEEAVMVLAKKRIFSLKGLEPQKKRQRLYGYLMRRGFSPDVVLEALDKVL